MPGPASRRKACEPWRGSRDPRRQPEHPGPGERERVHGRRRLRLTHVGAERVEGTLDLGPEHHTPWGVVHGGVYTAAIESAASVGASAAVAERGQIAVGVNNTTDFLRSMTAGSVAVIATPVQQGRTQQLWDVRITDPDGRLVARGTVRLQNVEPRR